MQGSMCCQHGLRIRNNEECRGRLMAGRYRVMGGEKVDEQQRWACHVDWCIRSTAANGRHPAAPRAQRAAHASRAHAASTQPQPCPADADGMNT